MLNVLVLTCDNEVFWETLNISDSSDYAAIAAAVSEKFDGDFWPSWSFVEFSLTDGRRHDTVTVAASGLVFITTRNFAEATISLSEASF